MKDLKFPTSLLYALFFIAATFPKPIYADIPMLAETLKQAEGLATQNSGILKASKESYFASERQANASEATLYPRLTLDGTYFYQTNVAQIDLGAYGFHLPPISFGDYNNYNIGPTLSYIIFDGSNSRRLWKSGKLTSQMRNEDSKATEKQILLNTRLAYSTVQLDIKNLTLTANSLKLSQARERDIRNRFRAGASSRLDAVNAKREVLSYQLKFRQAQNDLAAAIRDLLAITGETQQFDISRPWPKDLADGPPEGVEKPTYYVQADPLESNFDTQPSNREDDDRNHPLVKSLFYAAEASKLSADAQTSGLWPKIQFSARSEYMYPNGPILQTVQQNIFTVNLSMPLFEGDLSRNLAEQRSKEAASYEYQRQQKLSDLERDRRKAHDLLENLVSQQTLSHENSQAAAEAARLTYQSYKAGKQQYLDVETAHLSLLEAQVGEAQIESNILKAIAQLKYLSLTDLAEE